MNKTNTRKALNPAYRKHKPLRKDVTNFIVQLQDCINAVKLSDDNGESEEHIKSHFTTFFNTTFYANNYINTKDRIDLAIYLEDKPTSDIGVIIEAKKPSNKAEFLREDNLNRKALQELLLYYLRERLDNNNNNIKHLIATNGYEWYLFKSEDFYNYFFKNKALIKEYKDFRDGLKDTTKNELFYNEIAKKYIAEIEQDLPFVHLDFTKTNLSKLKDGNLNTLYKIFSDVHILGHPFGNDSNQLNKTFYNELLHIIGLEEVKDKGKKIINRKEVKDRDYASLLENTIFHLEDRDYLSNIKSIPNGVDKPFNAGLELCLTWVNRILFLKLLESQLLTYHQNDEKYKFLNAKFINGFDDLNDLFFSALAKQEDQRHPKYKDKYKDIPYLNSSLFERNTLEGEAFEISALNNDEIAIYSGTVLKDANGKKQKGKLTTLEYLFKFLDAYNFATDGTEGIEDEQETKSLINASVLGLIFEKINGYKEGSIYTPAYITMYMCRETIRRTVVQKFKEQEEDQIETFQDLQSYCGKKFKVDDLKRLNSIVNSIKICDPAVGSGHFLVSALNELIVIKNELRILTDAKGMPLRCDIEIVNDELYVIDDRGALFEYNPTDKESVRVQHTLFHEKQTLIENCLFGVDINPNSVKICRLRLWIELLKNAYYTPQKRLQTLPNIDINIKCGNSLISRFNLDDDLKNAFRNRRNQETIKYSLKDYKNAVLEYKETNSKDRKREVLQIINEVKNNFQSTLTNSVLENYSKEQAKVVLEQERQNNLKLFDEKITAADKRVLKELKAKADKALTIKKEIVNNAVYHNSFEWRFEFPEVLNDEGQYIGFDAVIGNPPYVQMQSMKEMSKIYKTFKYATFQSSGDLYALFYEKGEQILASNGYLGFITGSAWMRANYGKSLRNFFINKTAIIELIDFSDCEIFDSATVLTNIMLFQKAKQNVSAKAIRFTKKDQHLLDNLKSVFDKKNIALENLTENSWVISDNETFKIKNKVEKKGVKLIDWNVKITYGFRTGYNIAYILNKELKEALIQMDLNNSELIKPMLRGRDINKWHPKFGELWLLIIKKGDSDYIEENFPTIVNYLNEHKLKLTERAQVKNGSHHWLELDNSPNDEYVKLFSKPKIIYPELTKFLNFTIDRNGDYVTNNKCFILTGEKIYWLTSFFNSKLWRYCFAENFPELQGNTRELRKVIFEQIPIKKISDKEEHKFKEKIEEILLLKKEGSEENIEFIVSQIDQMVYKLYDLTEEEIAIVENS
ncbi:type IIG restriction enzyme/methyltransferase [Polaribacter atrinae]|uniref:type IIG restriction enzyme/methyltransferase n=1 Tax=Polaribacter atrinae TaxID=1333662 RepID=UPI00083935F3|nr:Eco57I restriction-modification methylase domain-containing protein [Polaribacter atrinae]